MKTFLEKLKEEGCITEFALFAIVEKIEKDFIPPEETLATKFPGKEWKEISQKDQNAMNNYNRAIKEIKNKWQEKNM